MQFRIQIKVQNYNSLIKKNLYNSKQKVIIFFLYFCDVKERLILNFQIINILILFFGKYRQSRNSQQYFTVPYL